MLARRAVLPHWFRSSVERLLHLLVTVQTEYSCTLSIIMLTTDLEQKQKIENPIKIW